MNIEAEKLFLCLKHIVLMFLIWFISTIGDTLLKQPKVQQNIVSRAVVDNATHFLLGGLSWTITISCQAFSHYFVWEIILCSMFSSGIDIDHFLMAKSIKIEDAVNLPTRPPFHNSLIMLASDFIFILAMYHLQLAWWKRIGFIFAVAVISHHLRDSLRRGLYLWPMQATKPVNIYCYLAISYIFPLICHFCLKENNQHAANLYVVQETV